MKRRAPLQIGEKYGRLTVLEYLYTDEHPRKYFKCVCECGGDVITHANALRSGNTKSCGCLMKDAAAARRAPGNHSEITSVILSYKRHAKGRGHEWGLSRTEVEGIVRANCHYCGTPPANLMSNKNTIDPLAYNGIDRVDNTKGYVSGNVVPSCYVCNRAKQTMTVKEFFEWARRLGAMADQWGRFATMTDQPEPQQQLLLEAA
jgi:hypothetical protein